MADYLFMTELTPPVMIKSGAVFLMTDCSGKIVGDPDKGLGLFANDTRFLRHYEARLGGAALMPLMSCSSRDFMAVLELTNEELMTPDGVELDKQSVGLRWERTVDGGEDTLTDVFSLRNYTKQRVRLPLSLTLEAAFEDIFVLRGAKEGRRGRLHEPRWDGDVLCFRYDGADEVGRQVEVLFSRPPAFAQDGPGLVTAVLDLDIATQETESLTVSLRIAESTRRARSRSSPSIESTRLYQRQTEAAWLEGFSRLASSDCRLDKVFDRSLRDLRLLWTDLGDRFIAGGLPWFVSPFGRDSIIGALQSLPYEPAVAVDTARLFAKHQGCREDAETGEQPGKIAHELRIGEMARLGEIPQRPSYVSVDATPLFLILIARQAAWTGSLELFTDLRPQIDAAVGWLDTYGDANADGYVDYDGRTCDGLVNQGWKDSGTAITRRGGDLPEPPIALVEVQGYVYEAKSAIADLYRRAGDERVADQLIASAEALRERFRHDFWMEDEGCYCLALEAGGRQVSVIASNAGQALWTGIADMSQARRTAERLMRPDMFSGWGIRTLSEADSSYNPINYHLGSVWPFDNALILAGFRRYGLDEPAIRIVDAMLDAADHFAYGRLPEFFVGLPREPGLFPARCPLADPLQAWSAGAVPLMIEALLGLRPEAFDNTLRIVRPLLPRSADWLELRGLRVGQASADLRFERTPNGDIATVVLHTKGELQIVVT